MVIVSLIGGLGNQMFQYAAGRALSLKHDVPLRLDLSKFAKYRLHQGYELQRIFGVPAQIASKGDKFSVLGWQSPEPVRRIVARSGVSGLRTAGHVLEPHFRYWAGIRRVPNNCYLEGYWQSEKYFRNSISQIRQDFVFTPQLLEPNLEVVQNMTSVNAVSLHIRRGDYAADPATAATYGLCSLEYYGRALEYISQRVPMPTFFVFSDDIEWAQKNLRIDFPCFYVTNNAGSESYNDMRLMSFCRHHIIANSSFSWWGAWLNSDLEKIVVAPQRWFSGCADVADLLPDSWVRL